MKLLGLYVSGIATVLLVVLLLGGVQLITIGIIGEYLGRVYDEVKRRPLYIVRDRVNMAAPEPELRGGSRDPPTMRIAVLGAGVTGLVAAYRLAGSTLRRLRALAGARRPGGDARRRRRPAGSSATTTTCSPATVHIAALYEELGMEDAIEWLPSSVAMFTEGRSLPVHQPARPAALQPAFAALAAADGAGRAAAAARAPASRPSSSARPPTPGSSARWGRRPGQKVWGPLLRGKFGDRAEEISMAWLWKKLTLRRQIKGVRRAARLLGYPRGGWQPLLERLRDEIEAGAGAGC